MDWRSKSESLFRKTWQMSLREGSQKMIKTGYLCGPNLRASLEKHINRIPVRSPVLKVQQIKAEEKWNARFTVTLSKDNQKYHKSLREYFDSEKFFDNGQLTPKSFKYASSTPSLPKLSSKKKLRSKPQLAEWKDIYAPISEFNVTKHPSNRQYFQKV